MDYGYCKDCRGRVVYARSAATGNRMSLDPLSIPEGNILVDGFGHAHVFKNPAAARAHQDAHPDEEIAHADPHLSHYATCPAKKRSPAPDTVVQESLR